MTKYSKKICKITKKQTNQTKRRTYRRKNSLRNKKLHGGAISVDSRSTSSTVVLPDINNLFVREFHELVINPSAQLSEQLSNSDSEFTKNYNKLLTVYNQLIANIKDKHKAIEAKIQSLDKLYSGVQLSKINPELPNLLATCDKDKKCPILGKGTFGVVYKLIIHGKEYALKVITKQESIDDSIHTMKTEVVAYNKISSLICASDSGDNELFCKFINMYCDDTTFTIYVLMEYCGKSLYDIISQCNKYISNISIIYSWLKTVAMGIQCMHKNNYAHLDIKPDNITISSTDQAKLIDFGLSYDFSETTKIPRRGTIDYAHPKLLDEKLTDITQCDIYSLGITFIQCAFAIHYPDMYAYMIEHETTIFYRLLRYIQPVGDTPTEIELTFNRAETQIYDLSDTLDDDDEFPHRQIYDAIASIKTMYPVLLQMIDSNPVTRITIPDIISACTPKPEVHSK